MAEDHVRRMAEAAERFPEEVKQLGIKLGAEYGEQMIDMVGRIAALPEVERLAKTADINPHCVGMNILAFSLGKMAATHPDREIRGASFRAQLLSIFCQGIGLGMAGTLFDMRGE